MIIHILSGLKNFGRSLEGQGGPTRGSKVFNTMIQMEADRLRENPQTPHQQETLQAITQGCTRLMRLLLAANNQATTRRKHKKLPSTSFNWVQAATDMHPACPNKKQNHLQNSLLRRTQFWVRKSFSKPASLKRASLVE